MLEILAISHRLLLVCLWLTGSLQVLGKEGGKELGVIGRTLLSVLVLSQQTITSTIFSTFKLLLVWQRTGGNWQDTELPDETISTTDLVL